MKKVLSLFAIASIALLSSCADTEIQETPILKEKAVVVTLIHSPSEHKTELTQTAYDHSSMMGTDYEGNTGFKVSKNLQVTTTTIPEKFGVAFQCEHGTFTVEGSETKHKVLYDKLYREVGDTVTVLYKEQYLLTYETKNKERVLVKKELRRLDFVDAQK
jgi:hypothetical protein